MVRACRDAGLASIAVYADPDAGAPFACLADEAVPLVGASSADTYLDIAKLLAAAQAMNSENPLIAPHRGRITGLRVRVGDTVVQGTALCRVTRADVVPAAPPGDATDEGTGGT